MVFICLYRKYFPADSLDAIMFEIPMALGQAMISTAMSLDSFLGFCGVTVEGFAKKEMQKQLNKVK